MCQSTQYIDAAENIKDFFKKDYCNTRLKSHQKLARMH